MHTPSEVLAKIKEQGVLPMFSTASEATSIKVLQTLYKAGMRVMEYTNRLPESLNNFKKLKAERDATMPDMLIGVGTVKTVDDAHIFIAAGADFIICPGMIPEVGKIVIEAGLVWSPGCMTVSEIMVAEQVGSQLVKLFPGNLLGPSYIGAIKEIFPKLAFMPTGGVELERDNISAWFKAGACAVGMGSKLVSKPLMESEKYDTIEERARLALNIVINYRKPEAEKQAE